MQAHEEKGQVTILVLGFALVAFAVAGLAVDGTRAFLMRRSMQAAADAATLAAAGELDVVRYYESGGEQVWLDPAAARAVAQDWLAARGLPATAIIETTPQGVALVLRGRVRATFLGLVGIDELPVAVEARAEPVAGAPAP